MTSHFAVRLLAASCCALVLAACSSDAALQQKPVLIPASSVEDAEQRLAAVADGKAAIEARFATRQAQCYEKFFVNRCLDEAAENRRTALAAQREIEIDAARYLRRVKVEERDRALAEAQAAYEEEEARMAADPAPVREPVDTALPPARPGNVAERVARQQQKSRQDAARAQSEAEERAAKAREFAERRAKAEQRQQEVARRVAEREARAARQAEREAQQAAPKQAAPKQAAPQNPPSER